MTGSRFQPSIGRRFAVVVLVLTGLGATAAVGQQTGRCVGVLDGDTLLVEIDSSVETIRLWGIDAPEADQTWGEESRQFLEMQALDRMVEMNTGDERPDLIFAVVSVDGQDLARAVLGAGMAFLPRSRPTSEGYAADIFVARSGRRGMWSADTTPPLHPEDWLAQQRAAAIPTPTPIPKTLSDIADNVEIAGEADGSLITNQDLEAKGISLPDSDYSRCMLPLIGQIEEAAETMRSLTSGLKMPKNAAAIEELDNAIKALTGRDAISDRLWDCHAARHEYDGHRHIGQAVGNYERAAEIIKKNVPKAWSYLSKGDVEMIKARKAYNLAYQEKQRLEAERNAGKKDPWRR